MNLYPEIVSIGSCLDHLKDSVFHFNALLGHENETGVRSLSHLLAKRPASALNGRLNTIVIAGTVERDCPTETDSITLTALPLVSLSIHLPAWLLAGAVVTQLIAVSLNLHEFHVFFLLFFLLFRLLLRWTTHRVLPLF